ncbi:MAG: methylmalonyl-CoA mutase, partial [Promethearchaeota archaeon]
ENVEKEAINALNELKKYRDNGLVRQKLKELKEVAQSDKNILPIMIETVESYATIQEICDILRDVFGEYQSPKTI